MDKMYHVGFDDTHGAKYVILPGDPGRVEKIARFLDEPHFYCQHREYTTWLGKVEGETVMVMSTGMGGPSTAIGVEECYKTGVRTFIRIGTTGGMNIKVMGGDLVIANSAPRARLSSLKNTRSQVDRSRFMKSLNPAVSMPCVMPCA